MQVPRVRARAKEECREGHGRRSTQVHSQGCAAQHVHTSLSNGTKVQGHFISHCEKGPRQTRRSLTRPSLI